MGLRIVEAVAIAALTALCAKLIDKAFEKSGDDEKSEPEPTA